MSNIKIKNVISATFSASVASYIMESYVGKLNARIGLTHGHYGAGNFTYAGDWKVDFDQREVSVIINNRSHPNGDWPRFSYLGSGNEIPAQIVSVSLDQIDDLRELEKSSYKMTPHLEMIIQQCKEFRDGLRAKEDLGQGPLRIGTIAEICFN